MSTARSPLRLLLLADTHLGFDAPRRPRIERRRRGPDFFANYRRALEPARRGAVDLVVHGGDLLYRSRVPASLVEEGLAPLREVAASGVPVVLVPGNHERSQIPFPLLAACDRLHVLDRPRTVGVRCRGIDVAVSGFPFVRDDVRRRFRQLLAESGFGRQRAAIHLLSIHQTVEGARVGPAGYTFRGGRDVIAAGDLPSGCAAVLAGHIHRQQVLTRDLRGSPLPAPVLYPGSIERTSMAERWERKGYLILELEADEANGGRLCSSTFHPLPTRPMVQIDLFVGRLGADRLLASLRSSLDKLDADSVVQLRPRGELTSEAVDLLRAARLRALVPSTMTVSVAWPGGRGDDPAAGRA